ncbi:hypothetical protein ACEV9S_24740, partial [Vibrio parahaemolyticus]
NRSFNIDLFCSAISSIPRLRSTTDLNLIAPGALSAMETLQLCPASAIAHALHAPQPTSFFSVD